MNLRISLGKAIAMMALVAAAIFASIAYATVTNLALTSPMGGENWAGTQDITWTATADPADPISIALSSDSGVSYTTLISGVTAIDGTYSWNTTLANDGVSYRVKVTDGILDGSSGSDFTIDNTPPTIAIVGGTDVGPVQTDTINITTTDATSGVASQEYGFSSNSTCDASDTYGNVFTSGADFDITGDHTDYLCAQATDNAGNIGYLYIGQLNTDNTAPSVLSYTLDGDTADAYFNSSVDTVDIDITANETVAWTTVRIQDVATDLIQKDYHPSGTSSTVTVTWDGDVSTGGPLVDGKYKVYYTITDLAGNVTGPLSGPLVPHYIYVDRVSPTVTSIVGTTIQGAGDTIVIAFSEDVVAADGDWTDGDEFSYESPIGVALDTTNATFAFNATANELTVTLNEAVDSEWLKNGDIVRIVPVVNPVDLAGNTASVSIDSAAVSGDSSKPTHTLAYDIDRQVKDADTIVITATFNEEIESTPQIAIATAGDGSLVATNMTIGANRTEWTYSWNVPAGSDDDGTATITLTGEDLAGNPLTVASDTRVIDNTDPTVDTFTKPVADTVYRADTVLTFTASDTGSGAGPVCTYSLNGGVDVTTICAPTDLAVAGLAEGRNTLDVTVTDEAGNSTTSSSVSFVYDTDGILTVDDTPGNNPDFDTLQGAIGAQVTGITTIDIASGTYAESGQILIDEDLIITGDSANKPVISPVADFSATKNVAGAWVLVEPNVTFTISDVEFDGAGHVVWQALRSHGNTSVDNVDFKNIAGSVSGSPYQGMAIEGFGGTVAGGAGSDSHIGGLAASHLIVTDSTFENIGRIGVLIKGTGATADILNNTYTGKGVGDWLDYAFEFGAGGSGTVEGNTISGNRGVASDTSTSAGVLITTYYGNGTDTEVNGNTFTDNSTAIVVGYNSLDTSVVTAEYNNINSNNGAGIVTTSLPVGADKNWWGDVTGPYNAIDNPAGLGSSADDDIDFSPFCIDVPVYNAGADTWSCELASVDPIDYFDLEFAPTSALVNNNATVTITGYDANDIMVVNDNTTSITMSADSGASLGALLLTMETDGDVDTTVTNNAVGIVNILASASGGMITGTGSVGFTNSDTAGPTVTAQSPTDNATGVSINAVPYIEFNEALKSSTVNSSNIQLRKYSDDSVISATVALVEGDTKVTITPDSALDASTQYYLYASSAVTDPTGNALQTDYDESEKADHDFTTAADTADHDAPTVASTNPTVSATGVSVGSNVTITFSEALDAATVSAASVQLLDASNAAVSATLLMSDGNTKVVIMPDSNLGYSAVYHVDVTSTVADDAGNPFAGTVTVTTFTTDAAPATDTTAPVVTVTSPTTGSAGVAINVHPTITFDDVLDATTITSSNVKLVKNSDSSILSAVVALVEGGKTILITPSANLENGTDYHVEITTDVKNETGLAFAGSTDVTTFTTETITPFTVDSIEAVASTATADDTYLNGWHYVYHLTVNSGETDMKVKFADWVNSANASDIVAANSNMRALFNGVTGAGMGSVVGLTEGNVTGGFGDVDSFTVGNAYTDQSTAMVITPSMDTNLALTGVQVQFDVFTKLPVSTAAGLYTTTYGIEITN